MKLRPLLAAALVLGGTGLCARLGIWQLSRWHEKRALNELIRAAEKTPPIEAGAAPAWAKVRGHYLAIAGHYDERHQILLGGHLREEVPGVEVVTPLVLEDGSAVLVNRGWISVEEPGPVRLGAYGEPGPRRVIGYPEPLLTRRRTPALATRTSDSSTVLWGRDLDLDTLSARLPYRLVAYALRQAPGPGVPARPARSRPLPLDEGMHLGYAIQWFAFGFILLGGSIWLTWQRKQATNAVVSSNSETSSGSP